MHRRDSLGHTWLMNFDSSGGRWSSVAFAITYSPRWRRRSNQVFRSSCLGVIVSTAIGTVPCIQTSTRKGSSPSNGTDVSNLVQMMFCPALCLLDQIQCQMNLSSFYQVLLLQLIQGNMTPIVCWKPRQALSDIQAFSVSRSLLLQLEIMISSVSQHTHLSVEDTKDILTRRYRPVGLRGTCAQS